MLRFSRWMLTLKYVNREEAFGAVLPLVFFASLATIAFLVYLASDFSLLIQGRPAQAILREKFIAQRQRKAAPIAASLFAHGEGVDRGPAAQFRYEYSVNGKPYIGTSHVSHGLWQQAVVGQPIDILYHAENPQHQLMGTRWTLAWALGWGVLPMLLAIGLWFAAYLVFRAGVRNISRQVNLVCDGTATLALVDAYEITTTRKQRSYVSRFSYTYLVTDHNHQRKLERVENGPDQPIAPVAPGDLLLVLYDPQDPTNHTIDRFDARRADRLRLEAETEISLG